MLEMKLLYEEALAEKDALVSCRRTLHQMPEIGRASCRERV